VAPAARRRASHRTAGLRLGARLPGWGSPRIGAAPRARGDGFSFVEIAPEDTLGEAVERIVARGDGPALVADYGRLIGVLSAHDVLRAVAERVHPSDGRAREWMSDPLATVAPDDSPDEAAARMIENGVHHLLVVEGERPVGVVALREVVSGRPGRRA
jgi:CBS domain-containing protein